jgi:hypothetical protein
MGALMGAGAFGLVPYPVACLKPPLRDQQGSRLCAEDDHPALRAFQDGTSRELIAQPRHKLEIAGTGGGAQ